MSDHILTRLIFSIYFPQVIISRDNAIFQLRFSCVGNAFSQTHDQTVCIDELAKFFQFRLLLAELRCRVQQKSLLPGIDNILVYFNKPLVVLL